MTVVNVTPPVVSGTAQVGQTLSTTNGTWTHASGTTLSYARRWLRCDAGGANCAAIPAATASSYRCVPADVGATLRSEITATESAIAPTPVLPDFDEPAFTALRTVTCTSVAQFNAAWAALLPGDLIDVQGVTFTGEVEFNKNPADWVEVHFDSNCFFTGPAAGSQLPTVWVHDASNIRFYGGDITGDGNNGIRFDDTTDILWWDFYIHDTAGTGVLVRGISGPLSGLDLRGEITNTGLDLSLDPHAELGTGNHGCNMGTGTGQPVTDSRFVLTIHDQPYGAAIEVENTRNTDIYLDARRITFHAVQQTGGNAIQFWGSGTSNVTIPFLFADVCEGRAVEMGGLGGGNSGIVVEYGRATNIRLTPEYEPNAAITYQDVS